MNLMLHSITNPDIDYKDSVSKQNSVSGKYTVCLANPPFKGSVDAESINDNLKSCHKHKKDGTAVPCTVPASAAKGRQMCLYRA
jgi:type I restriction enzyme M protein